MRTVRKENIDRLLDAVDEYGRTLGYADIDSMVEYEKAHICSEIAAEDICGSSLYGTFDYSLMGLIRSLRIICPVKYCTDKEIYAILKMLDIEVIEEQNNDG